MNHSFYYLLAFCAGGALSVQLGVNSQLKAVLGHPVMAALVSFLVGTVALIMYFLLFQRESLSTVANLSGMAWYKWSGGLIGAMFISGVIIIAPRIGAANTAALVVAGQVLLALLLDHYGLLGFIQHPFNMMRFIGAALLIGGVFLILKN